MSLNAMMADAGWQNKQSVFQPNPSQFPNGMSDLAALGDALRQNGTSLGLWIALNGYNNDTNWGVTHGYELAMRNSRYRL